MNIGYIVEEYNRMGSVRSRLFTSSPWHAMAEWLVKSYRPIGFPPGVRVGDGELSIQITGSSVVVDHAFLSMTTVFTRHGEEVRRITIRTEIQTQAIEPHYSCSSNAIYLTEDYYKAILSMKDKLVRYSKNQIDVAYVLSMFASNDRLHQFWVSRLAARKMGL